MDEIYLSLDNGQYIKLFWSDNTPADPDTATGVIGINIYDSDGLEYDGGELDIQNDDSDIHNHIQAVLEFMDLSDVSYEEISENDFDSIVE